MCHSENPHKYAFRNGTQAVPSNKMIKYSKMGCLMLETAPFFTLFIQLLAAGGTEQIVGSDGSFAAVGAKGWLLNRACYALCQLIDGIAFLMPQRRFTGGTVHKTIGEPISEAQHIIPVSKRRAALPAGLAVGQFAVPLRTLITHTVHPFFSRQLKFCQRTLGCNLSKNRL